MNRKLIFGIFILMFLLVGTVSASYINMNKNYAGQGDGSSIYIDTGIDANTIEDFEIVFKYENYDGVYDMIFGSIDADLYRYMMFHSSTSAFYVQLGKSWVVNLHSLSNHNEIYKLQIIKNTASNYRIIYTNLNTNTVVLDSNYETLDSSPVSTNNLGIYARIGATAYHTSRTIYSFKINDETWHLDEGQGSTITGDQGTELTVQGTLTNFWVDGDTTASNKNLQISSLQKGLVGHWTLDQNSFNSVTNRVDDLSPYENHFTNSGATSTTDRNGNANSAMAFDGSTNYAIINDNFVVSPTELTISAWLKKESGGATFECVLHKSSDATIGASEFWLGVDSSDLLTATIGARTGVSGTWAAGRTTTTAIYGQWYLLTATWNGTMVKVYLDGEYNKQYALTTYSNINMPTRIGASSNGANYQFKGAVDDVRIYNRALSADEVKQLYESHKPQISGTSLNKGLIANYKLDEYSYNSNTNRIDDLSPYENHGTNDGSTLTTDRFGNLNSAMNLSNSAGTNYIKPIDFGLTLNNESIAFWMKCDFPRLDSEGGGFTNRIIHWGRYYNSNSGGYGLQSGALAHFIKGSTSSGWSTAAYLGSVAYDIYDAGGWIHYAVVFVGSNTIKFYMNGIEIRTSTISDAFTGYSHNEFNFGKDMWSELDDVKIYNRVLSQDEVKQLYNQGR